MFKTCNIRYKEFLFIRNLENSQNKVCSIFLYFDPCEDRQMLEEICFILPRLWIINDITLRERDLKICLAPLLPLVL